MHVNFPSAAPAVYAPGDDVTFDVSGWSFSNADDIKDTEVVVKLGATTLGTFPLDNTIQAALPGFDATGTTSVDVTLPAGTPDGPATLLLTGATTGTEIPVVVTVDGVDPVDPPEKADAQINIKVKPSLIKAGKTRVKLIVKVKADGVDPVTGKVKITVEGKGTKTIRLKNGRAVWELGVFNKAGKRTVKVKYLGNSLVKRAKDKQVITVQP